MSDVPPARLDLERSDEEPSEAIPIQFNLHSCYYNDFFLLRTLITINGTPAEIKINPSKTPFIQNPETGMKYPLSQLSHGVANKLTKKHGVYHIDTFYHEEAPLFSVVFPSQSALRKFLENREKVESDLVKVFSTYLLKTESESTHTPGHHLSVQKSQLQVSINAELFLASPTHSTEQGQQPSWPVMRKVTLATFGHYIEKWQQSKLFDFDKSMFSDDNLDQRSTQVEEAKLKDLQRELKAVIKWFQFGLELDIPDHELLIIREDIRGVEKCLLEVLIRWQDREKPTWTKVVGALVKIGRHVLAENISRKYGVLFSPNIASSDAVIHCQTTEGQLLQKQLDLDVALQSREKLVEGIENELIDLQVQNNSLQNDIELLEDKLKLKHEESEFLKQSKESFWNETVERMKRKYNEKIKKLQKELAIKKNKLALIKEQLKQKEKELEAKIAQVEEKSALVKDLREEVEKLKQSFSEQQQEMNRRQIESTAYSIASERHLEEVKLQLEHGKQEVELKRKEIETHTHDLAIKDKQIRQLSETILESKTKMDKLQEEAVLSQDEQKILKLSLCVKMCHLKKQLDNAENAKWLSQFKLKKAQEHLQMYKSSIPDISKCTVILPLKKLEKHTLSHLRVCLFDKDGDPCSGSHHIDTKLTLLANDSIVAGTFSKPVKDNPGEYVVSFTPTRAGQCKIQVAVNGNPLPSGPIRVMVYSYLKPNISKCIVSLPQEQLEKHTLSHLRVYLSDEDGDPCCAIDCIYTKLTLLADVSIVAGIFSKLVKVNPGEYVVSFTPTRAGDCEIQGTVNGTHLPLRVTVYSYLQPDISKCTVTLSQEKLEKHTPSHLRVCLFDEDGDPCSGSHHIDTKLTLLADDSIVAGIFSKPVKKNLGEYVVSFTPTRAGDCKIQVTVNGTNLPSGPLIKITSGASYQILTPSHLYIPQVVEKLEAFDLNDKFKEPSKFAQNICDPEFIRNYFCDIVEHPATSTVSENIKESDSYIVPTTPRKYFKALYRGKCRFSQVISFPLRLIFILIPKNKHSSSFFKQFKDMFLLSDSEFGFCYVILQVGDVILDWNHFSLVVPNFSKYDVNNPLFKADIQHLSSWADFTHNLTPKLKKAASNMDYLAQIELAIQATVEKSRLIDNLVEVIVKYNRYHCFSLSKKNSFVFDALKALGVILPIRFPGRLGKYYKALMFSTSYQIQSDLVNFKFPFKNHVELDEHVRNLIAKKSIDSMPQADVEFLLVMYFKFHRENQGCYKSDSVALKNWKCTERECLMQELESKVQLKDLAFKTI